MHVGFHAGDKIDKVIAIKADRRLSSISSMPFRNTGSGFILITVRWQGVPRKSKTSAVSMANRGLGLGRRPEGIRKLSLFTVLIASPRPTSSTLAVAPAETSPQNSRSAASCQNSGVSTEIRATFAPGSLSSSSNEPSVISFRNPEQPWLKAVMLRRARPKRAVMRAASRSQAIGSV